MLFFSALLDNDYCAGEVIIPEIDLTIDTPVWYRIENPGTPGIKKPNQYFPASPTLSLDGTQRSLSGLEK